MTSARPIRSLTALALAAALVAPGARAAPAWAVAGPTDKLALDLPADAALTLGGFLYLGATELLKGSLTPATCRTCNGPATTGLAGDPNNGPGTLNGLDAWFHDGLTGAVLSRKGADTFSNVLAYGLVPLAALGSAGFATGPTATPYAGLRAGVIVAEGAAVAIALTQSLKFLAARNRPFVRYGHATDGATSDEGKTYDVNNPDSRAGFPSGHTTFTAALTFGAAMTAQLQDSAGAPWLWAGAGLATVLAGTSRMMAEKHYFTDVATGAVIGAGCGVLIPILHRPGQALGTDRSTSSLALHDVGLTAAPLPGGTVFSLGGRF